jgi:hypothetical protein
MRAAILCLLVVSSTSACSSSDPAPPTGVEGTPECDAYCAKIASLGCGASCNTRNICKIDEGSCAAAARAKLDCKVKKGVWACLSTSGGYSVVYSCPDFKELCGGVDAGTADTRVSDTSTSDTTTGDTP